MQERPSERCYRLARLGVRLENSPSDDLMVHYNRESSLVVEEHLDPSLIGLKESVLDKLDESITLGGMVF